MADLGKRYLFRMVHIQNIPHILEHGITHTLSPKRNPDYTPIGDSSLITNRKNFTLSNGHALEGLSTLYNHAHATDIDELIDIKAINAKYWNDEKDLDLKRRKEAEFLVENDIPAPAILGYVVYNKASKDKLVRLGIEEKTIFVKEVYYF